jgi:hypothetical protein
MTSKQWIVAALLRLYPAAWRSEYGPELQEILLARPLSPRVIGDLTLNALRQRAQGPEPSTILGLASMLVILIGFVLTGGSYGRDWTALLQPSSKTFPTVTVTFLASEVYVLLLVGCGCWTHLRHGGTANQSGVAAVRMSLIAAIPILLGALLMMSGLISLRSLGPHLPPPSSLAILVSPLARLPESWIWGALGGQLGKWNARRRHHARAGVIRP